MKKFKKTPPIEDIVDALVGAGVMAALIITAVFAFGFLIQKDETITQGEMFSPGKTGMAAR